MILKDYNFLKAKQFPICFYMDNDYYSCIDVHGILKSGESLGESYIGEPLIIFSITKHTFSAFEGFAVSVYKLTDFISCFGPYTLKKTEKKVKMVTVPVATRKSDGTPYIILEQHPDAYHVRKVYRPGAESYMNITYTLHKTEFEDIKEELIREDLLNDGVE